MILFRFILVSKNKNELKNDYFIFLFLLLSLRGLRTKSKEYWELQYCHYIINGEDFHFR